MGAKGPPFTGGTILRIAPPVKGVPLAPMEWRSPCLLLVGHSVISIYLDVNVAKYLYSMAQLSDYGNDKMQIETKT